MQETLGIFQYLPSEIMNLVVGYISAYDDILTLFSINMNIEVLVRNCVTVVGKNTRRSITIDEILLLPQIRSIEIPLRITENSEVQILLNHEIFSNIEAISLGIPSYTFISHLDDILRWACKLKRLHYFYVAEEEDEDEDEDDDEEEEDEEHCNLQYIEVKNGYLSFMLDSEEYYLPLIVDLPYEGIDACVISDDNIDYLMKRRPVKKLYGYVLGPTVLDMVELYPSVTDLKLNSTKSLFFKSIRNHKVTKQITCLDAPILIRDLIEVIHIFPHVKTFHVDLEFPSNIETLPKESQCCWYDMARKSHEVVRGLQAERPDLKIIVHNRRVR